METPAAEASRPETTFSQRDSSLASFSMSWWTTWLSPTVSERASRAFWYAVRAASRKTIAAARSIGVPKPRNRICQGLLASFPGRRQGGPSPGGRKSADSRRKRPFEGESPLDTAPKRLRQQPVLPRQDGKAYLAPGNGDPTCFRHQNKPLLAGMKLKFLRESGFDGGGTGNFAVSTAVSCRFCRRPHTGCSCAIAA